jgi:hypothetical protein
MTTGMTWLFCDSHGQSFSKKMCCPFACPGRTSTSEGKQELLPDGEKQTPPMVCFIFAKTVTLPLTELHFGRKNWYKHSAEGDGADSA